MTEVALAESTTTDVVPADPYERAQSRLERLSRSFSEVLVTVGEMERDEDWKYLTRADGTPYTSLRAVIQDVMAISASMARRYIQGARGLYLPLSGVVVEGTTIEVTAADVANLGEEGMAEVVDMAADRLSEVDDPDEASQVIADTIAETRERREASDDDHDEADGFVDDGYEAPSDRATGTGNRATPSGGSDGDSFAEGYPSAATDPFLEDVEEPHDDGGPVDLVDPAERIMRGAKTYETPADRASLDPAVNEVAAALNVLSKVDPDAIAQAITYDTRGVLVPVADVLANVSRMRVLMETSPWFLARQGLPTS